jgi:tRNA pseudouridine13 synthase
MKLRQTPDDFQVQELPTVTPAASGRFAFYALDKRGWTTHDAVDLIRREWKLHPSSLSYGGLKDRHAATTQFLTIAGGRPEGFRKFDVLLRHLGYVDEAYTSEHFSGNRFRVTLRHMTGDEVDRAVATLDEVRSVGVANYFDDQRFGSVPLSGEFVGRAMVVGDWESALRLAAAEPYQFDRPKTKAAKKAIRDAWGRWGELGRVELPESWRAFEYLKSNPSDYRGAVLRIRPEMLSLYLSAYQSHVWNRAVDQWIRTNVPADRLAELPLKLGWHATPRQLHEPMASAWGREVPLPSARQRLGEDDPWRAAFDAVLDKDGLSLDELRLPPDVREPFFSKGARPACEMPRELGHEVGDDELNKGRKKLTLSFVLGRGSYATMVVKRVSQGRTASAP